ncbi:dipeptidase [Sedimentitalea todarodis]|uniref:Dipeptidase n=1 Tax=Sedimentitalea todarodis TaxID=1631240 RepID=A0ABU3VF33_9RHOB|nr:dipeptidase [Sedimentitalea todarodis]MDU9004793.1 dipeptidase [Sedimentitalea todarodis]
MTELVPVFDGHNDTLLKLEIAARLGRPLTFAQANATLDIDLPAARKGGFAGGFFAMFTPSRLDRFGVDFDYDDPSNFDPISQSEALNFTLAMFARMRRLERELPEDLAICEHAADVRSAIGRNRIAMIPHIEGAECIDTELNALEVLHAAGLRSLGLVWSRDNAFGHGAPMEAQPQLDPGQGLTDAGFELVRECDRLGILVDLSHLTEAGFWDVASTTNKPLIATHSNAHAVSPSGRNLTDRQLSAVAESGGVVGLNFHVGFLRADCKQCRDTPVAQMIRHLDHMIGILGENGVALGSDFDGCLLPREIGGVAGLPILVAAMRDAGFGDALIDKICHENWLSALEKSVPIPAA